MSRRRNIEAPPQVAPEYEEKPYPGLRPYNEDENHLFFGRDQQANELMARLRNHRFLAVLGSSGSGKSSLVKAGLMPSLHSGYMTTAGSRWSVALMRPGLHPVESLGAALAELVPGQANSPVSPEMMIRTMLNANSSGLVKAAQRMILKEGTNLLLVVDQFEELFRFASGEVEKDEAGAFIKLILTASREENVPIYVIITMRSDFLSDCPRFQGLPEAINSGQYLVPRLTRDQLREVITGPAAVFYQKTSIPLQIRLLNDVNENPDRLPILAHALMRTWVHWETHKKSGEPIDLDDYEGVGGMEDALNRHANEIMEELKGKGLESLTERVFKALTVKGPDNRGVRRPTRLCKLAEICNAREDEVVKILEAFRKPGRTFIMPPHTHPLLSETMVDISHESFMRVWKKLVRWVEEEGDSAEQYHRIFLAMIYKERGEGELLAGSALELALDWQRKNPVNSAWADQYDGGYDKVVTFLQDSVANRDRLEEERRKAFLLQEESKLDKAKLRTRSTQLVALLTVLAIIGFLAWSFYKKSIEATRNLELAEENRVKADSNATEARRFAELANAQADTAKMQRLIALQFADSAQIARALAELNAKKALQQADSASRASRRADKKANDALYQKGQAQKAADEAKLQERKADTARANAVLQRKKAETALHLLHAQKAATISLGISDKEVKARYALEAYVLNDTNGGNPNDPGIHEALTGAAIAFDRSLIKYVNQSVLAFASPRGSDDTYFLGNHASVGAYDGQRVQMVSPAGFSEVTDRFIAVSPDRNWVAMGDEKYRINLIKGEDFDLTRNQTLNPHISQSLGGHTGYVTGVAFSPDAKRMYSTGLDGNLISWDISGNPQKVNPEILISSSDALYSVCMDGLGRYLALGSGNGVFQIYRLADKKVIYTSRLGSKIHSLDISPNGKAICAGLADGKVVLFEGEPGSSVTRNEYRLHSSRVSGVRFSPDGKTLATCSYDQTIHLHEWKNIALDPPIILKGHQGWVTGITFNASGDRLISAGNDRTLRMWFTQAGDLKDFLQKNVSGQLNVEQKNKYLEGELKGLKGK
ncbi:MAG: hypothetical protein H6581_15870 [Bacteroidia bacterium]|nr:hypothetical protein [Bacteroidia bacterium]